MARRARLPKVVHVGLGYKVRIILASQTEIREAFDDDEISLDGCWVSSEEGYPEAGVIYIHNKLSSTRKREVYWHELLHAINDIMAVDQVSLSI